MAAAARLPPLAGIFASARREAAAACRQSFSADGLAAEAELQFSAARQLSPPDFACRTVFSFLHRFEDERRRFRAS